MKSLINEYIKETEVGGYTFTGSDFITPNLYEVHHDPRNFTNPFSFNPERFIDETSGKFREAIQRTGVE